MKIYKCDKKYYIPCENNNFIKDLIENICKNNNISIDNNDKCCCKYIAVNIAIKRLFWEILSFTENLKLNSTNVSIIEFYNDIIRIK